MKQGRCKQNNNLKDLSSKYNQDENNSFVAFVGLFQRVREILKADKHKLILSIVIIIYVVFMTFFFILSIISDNPQKIWERAQITQRDASFFIEGEKKQTYIRTTGESDEYKTDIRYYKSGNRWRAEEDVFLSVGEDSLKKHIIVSLYDGQALHDYVIAPDSDNPDLYAPTELSINKGMIIYEQEKEEGREVPLEDIIADFNYMNAVVNWFDNKYPQRKEHPKITGKKIINGYPCINIQFSKYREACINEDYGIAVYWKIIINEEHPEIVPNKKYITEYNVYKVKNDKLDNIKVDESLFLLPQVTPWHEYGKY